MATRKKPKNENFFVRFWNGQLSLPMSYWVVGILMGFAFGFIVGIIVFGLGMHEDAIFGFIIPWQIYTVVGIWRSSNKYKGPKGWAILAKVAVILGAISFLSDLLTGK